jgi:very-short-patch-repair endonuclease
MLVNPEDAKLTKGMQKEVSLICDYCGEKFTRRWDQRVVSNKYVDKDSCKKCSMKKREETSLAKYGTRIPSQNVEVRKRASATKGGSGKCVADYHDTILEMYQGDMSVNEIAAKLKLGRSALRTYMQSIGLDTKGDMQAKAKRTCKERYGVEHFLQSETGQDKLKEVFKDKYGSENPFNNPEFGKMVREKQKNTTFERYGVTDILNCDERREEHEKKRLETRKANGQLIYDGKTVTEWAKEKDISISGMYQRIEKLGLEQAIMTDKNMTKLEAYMSQLLRDIGVTFRTQVAVDKRIADFHIDDTNILIETDGLYWHSDIIIAESTHHARKRNTYINNGYLPLFFREDEIYNKPEVVKSIIRNKLGQSNRIYARDCQLVQKEKGVGHDFVAQNHLMGRGKNVNFTLEKDGEILSCLTLKRVNDKMYEISRFCHKCNHSVIGGFSRLVKFAQNRLEMEELFTFIDLRYGGGQYLLDLGFEHVSERISFKWTDFKNTYHRMRFPSNNGYKNGLFKIYDCGQAKYSLNFQKLNN